MDSFCHQSSILFGVPLKYFLDQKPNLSITQIRLDTHLVLYTSCTIIPTILVVYPLVYQRHKGRISTPGKACQDDAKDVASEEAVDAVAGTGEMEVRSGTDAGSMRVNWL